MKNELEWCWVKFVKEKSLAAPLRAAQSFPEFVKPRLAEPHGKRVPSSCERRSRHGGVPLDLGQRMTIGDHLKRRDPTYLVDFWLIEAEISFKPSLDLKP